MKAIFIVNALVAFALLTTPTFNEIKQIFAFVKSNPFEDSTLFDHLSNHAKKLIQNDMFYVNVVPGSDNAQSSGGS